MKKPLFLFALLSASLLSCEDEKTARIQVWLTDAPGDYQEVNVDVQGVEILVGATEDEGGWTAVEVNPQVYDLLELTNGEETLLGGRELPAGKISQIRLKLGDNNTVRVDDETYSLTTPSGQQSGLKVQINKVLVEGITYKILIDFDAAKSVVHTGSNNYVLKPVIRAITEAQDGALTGKVEPAQELNIALVAGEDTVSTTSSNGAGEFLIQGIAAGTYTLQLDVPGEAPVIERTGVEIVLGEVTDVGVVTVEE